MHNFKFSKIYILFHVVSFALGDGTSDISQHNPYTFSDVLTNDGPKSLRTESSGSGTLQVITYTSSSTCSGQAAGATFFAVGPCVPIGFQGTTSQSSTISVSGNTATITSYSDTACKTTTGSPVPLLLNSCQGANGVSLINYFYSAGGVPPAPYTTTSGQVTVTLQ